MDRNTINYSTARDREIINNLEKIKTSGLTRENFKREEVLDILYKYSSDFSPNNTSDNIQDWFNLQY